MGDIGDIGCDISRGVGDIGYYTGRDINCAKGCDTSFCVGAIGDIVCDIGCNICCSRGGNIGCDMK